MKTNKTIERIFLYIVIIAGILYLRVVADYPEKLLFVVGKIADICKNITNVAGFANILSFLERIPAMLLLILGSCATVFLGAIVLLFWRRPMEQGLAIMHHTPLKAIGYGNLLYWLIFFAFFTFAFSVVGLPIAVFLFVFFCFAAGIGSIPLSLFLGELLCNFMKVSAGIYMKYLLGSFLILLCQSVYAVGSTFLLFVFPAISLGVSFVLFINRFYYKMSYPPQVSLQEGFDRKKIRDIITKGL